MLQEKLVHELFPAVHAEIMDLTDFNTPGYTSLPRL